MAWESHNAYFHLYLQSPQLTWVFLEVLLSTLITWPFLRASLAAPTSSNIIGGIKAVLFI